MQAYTNIEMKKAAQHVSGFLLNLSVSELINKLEQSF